jgi:hypothetical protein
LRITFANNYTTPGGRAYKLGSSYEVNDADARSLITRGKARPAETKSASAESTETKSEAE